MGRVIIFFFIFLPFTLEQLTTRRTQTFSEGLHLKTFYSSK